MIEFRQIMGRLETGEQIAQPVDVVRWNGREVGVVDRRIGAGLCLTQWLSPYDLEQLTAEFLAARAKTPFAPGGVGAMPISPEAVAQVTGDTDE